MVWIWSSLTGTHTSRKLPEGGKKSVLRSTLSSYFCSSTDPMRLTPTYYCNKCRFLVDSSEADTHKYSCGGYLRIWNGKSPELWWCASKWADIETNEKIRWEEMKQRGWYWQILKKMDKYRNNDSLHILEPASNGSSEWFEHFWSLHEFTTVCTVHT